MEYKHVFGPVPSRRLGISLGIDLVLNKSCNLNCVFCECGATSKIKKSRQSFKDVQEIKRELKEVLKTVKPDYITFSGAGEPTLSKDLGNIIKFIKEDLKYSGKIALITNSILLNDDELIEEILGCDLIIPTLNTVKEDIFQKISRAEDTSVIEVIEGLKKLSSSNYRGEIFLELFILENINDGEENLEGLAQFIKNIRYNKIQLNTVARIGTEKNLKSVSREKLEKIKKFLEDKNLKNVEIIASFKEKNQEDKIEINIDLYRNMLDKRNYSKEEIEKIYKK